MGEATPPATERLIRDAIAAADRRRRLRTASRRVWQVAPVLTAASLGVAVAGRWIAFPRATPLVLLAVIALAMAGYVWFSLRRRPVSDRLAAAIDADAAFGGELRSASWFAARQARDGWADLHLERAADRVRSVDWVQLYPPVRATRARAATAVMVVATLALIVFRPDTSATGQNASNPDAATVLPKPGAAPLDAELQKLLEELLAAADAGTLAIDPNDERAADLRELLAQLKQLRDREALKDLAHALDLGTAEGKTRTAQEMKALAERAKHAAEMSAASREFREAMEELARNLSEAVSAEQIETDEAAVVASGDPEKGDAGESNAASGLDQASIQSVKETEAGGASGMMMMSSKDAPAGDAPPGFGVGGSGSMSADGRMTEIQEALRQETVEASKDTAGDNVDALIRRKTEQGQATVTFTRGASARSDRNRAAAPPAVPEARRADVQRYFMRKQ